MAGLDLTAPIPSLDPKAACFPGLIPMILGGKGGESLPRGQLDGE